MGNSAFPVAPRVVPERPRQALPELDLSPRGPLSDPAVPIETQDSAIISSRRPTVAVDGWVIATLAAGGLLALRFPLHVSLSEKISVVTAVFFAAVLLLPVVQAAALVAAISGVDIAIAATRRVVANREKPPLGVVALSLFFNASQLYFSAWAAGLVLLAAGVTAGGGINRGQDALAVIAAAAAFYVTNHVLVATAVAFGTSRNPLAIMRTTQKVVLAQFAILYLIGAIAAYAAARWPWLLALTVVPAVLAYHSLRQRIEIRRDAMRAMERMADEVDRRDPYTYQHSQRVAIYAHAISRRLGFNGPEVQMIELAAKVHDIGKIRIPDAVLLKPGKLTDAERRVMQTEAVQRVREGARPGAHPSRAIRRPRLSERHRRAAPAADRAGDPGRGLVRRDDVGSGLPRSADLGVGSRGASPRGGHAVESPGCPGGGGGACAGGTRARGARESGPGDGLASHRRKADVVLLAWVQKVRQP